MCSKALVSVVTPAFNAANSITKAIESVQAQTYPYWEMLVVDDASCDETAEVVANLARGDSRIRLIRLDLDTRAPGRAKNAALPIAQGEFVAFLDADDWWVSNKLELQISRMLEHGADLSYTGGWYVDTALKTTGRFTPRYGAGWLFDRLLAQYEINNQTVMIRRQAIDALLEPYFSPEIVIGEDCEFFMRIARKSKLVGIPEPLVYYRVHRGSISATRLSEAHQGLQEVVRWVRQDAVLADRCRLGVKKADAKICFYKAKAAMAAGDSASAQKFLWSVALVNWRYAMLTLATWSPKLWRWCMSLSKRYS